MRPGPSHSKGMGRLFSEEVDLDADFMDVVDVSKEKQADADFFNDFEDDFDDTDLKTTKPLG